MKRYLLPALLLILAAFSCTRNREIVTNTLEHSYVNALSEGSRDSISINLILEYPTEGVSRKFREGACMSIASLLLGNAPSTDGEGYETLFDSEQEFVSRVLENYRTTFGEMHKDSGESGGMMSWEEYASGIFSGRNGGVISYLLHRASYEGGAHPNEWDDGMVLSLKDGRRIGQDEYFVEGYPDSLSVLLTRHLKEQSGSEFEELFKKDLSPNGNFIVSEEGVTFIFNPYEIAAYSFGTIKVTVPWSEASSLVRKQFR